MKGPATSRRRGRTPRRDVADHEGTGYVATQGTNTAVSVLMYVGFVPLVGLLLMPWVIETQGRPLSD